MLAQWVTKLFFSILNLGKGEKLHCVCLLAFVLEPSTLFTSGLTVAFILCICQITWAVNFFSVLWLRWSQEVHYQVSASHSPTMILVKLKCQFWSYLLFLNETDSNFWVLWKIKGPSENWTSLVPKWSNGVLKSNGLIFRQFCPDFG